MWDGMMAQVCLASEVQDGIREIVVFTDLPFASIDVTAGDLVTWAN